MHLLVNQEINLMNITHLKLTGFINNSIIIFSYIVYTITYTHIFH